MSERQLMAKFKGKSLWFTATVQRYGSDREGKPTMCLTDLTTLKGEVIADHIWLSMVKGGINSGTRVRFFGRVIRYKKPAERFDEPAVTSHKIDSIKHFKEI